MRKIGIIGFGRFGELLAKLSANQFEVHIIEPDENRGEHARAQGYQLVPLEAITRLDFIFIAVPISSFGSTVRALAKYVGKKQVVVDLCSVKVYPARLMQEHLAQCQLLASHPMFGPDSAEDGLSGLQVALCPLTIQKDNLKVIEDFWLSQGCKIIYTTPEDHDKDAVYSQAFAYSIAKLVLSTKLPHVKLQTRSFEAITEIAALSANDSEQLFHDMLFYNPYFSEMKSQLESAIRTVENKLNSIENEQSKAGLF